MRMEPAACPVATGNRSTNKPHIHSKYANTEHNAFMVNMCKPHRVCLNSFFASFAFTSIDIEIHAGGSEVLVAEGLFSISRIQG